MNSKLISIGKILNFHGIKGEVKMGFTSGKESVIKSLKKVYIFVDNKKVELSIEYIRFHKNTALIKFQGLDSINEILAYKGLLVHIYEEDLKAQLEKDEYLIKDLMGLEVFDTNGNKIGIVDTVGENRASNLICIKKSDLKTFMVPFVKELVPEVDIANKKIVINMIDGIDS